MTGRALAHPPFHTPPLFHINSWIFDLDNTLYRADSAFFAQIVDNITKYIARHLGLGLDAARALQKQYLEQYGTSLSGLMAVHGTDPAGFLDYVHDVDLSFLKPDPRLYAGLDALPGRKYIFTNGSQGHAKNVCEHLGIYHLFDGVMAIEDVAYNPKPGRSAYEKFVRTFNIVPASALMVEDMAVNLQVPKDMGMTTVLIAPPGSPCPDYIDKHTNDLSKWLSEIG